MIARRDAPQAARFSTWACLGVSLLAACSSSDEPRSIDPGSDAGDGGQASGDAASNEAGEDAGRVEPPPYDFAVQCTSEPCVTRISARGGAHACVIVRGGTVRCWGANDSGQLGTGASEAGAPSGYEATPQQVLHIANASSLTAAGDGISGATCVVSDAGEVSCFGSDAWGQLGRSSGISLGPHPEPVVIGGLRAKSVTLANTFAMAIDADNRMWSWGTNDVAQLGRTTLDPDGGSPRLPALAGGVSKPVRLSAGTSTNGFVVAESGELLSWGLNGGAQLGRPSSAAADPFARALSISDVSAVTAGANHACALVRGDVHCWGQNDHGQLGTSLGADESFPARVALPNDVYAVAVAAGGSNTCIIAANGDVYCWGANDGGQLGADVGYDQSTPKQIGGLGAQAVGVAVMDEAICALLRGGSVACWGDNLLGQLGRGTSDFEAHVAAAPVVFK